MTADEFTALLAFATAMSFSPGPNTTLATALAANFGLRRAMRFVVAVPAGEVVATGLDVHAPAGIRGQHALEFVIEAGDGSASERVDSTFLGPM